MWKGFSAEILPRYKYKTTVDLPIAWSPNQELSLVNALENIDDCIQNSGCNLKKLLKFYTKIISTKST